MAKITLSRKYPEATLSRHHAYSKPTRSNSRLSRRSTAGSSMSSRLPSLVSTGAQLLRRAASLTQRRNPIQNGRVMNEGTGGQYSYFNGKKGVSFLNPSVLSEIAPQVYTNVQASQLKSAVSLQAVSVPLTLFSPTLATAVLSDNISRLLYDHATGDVTVNNIYLSNLYMIIYDCVARRDSGSAYTADPLSSWSQGDTDTGVSTSYTKLGSTPWQTELFNQFWEVKQVTNIVLGSGATHVHKVRLRPHASISGARAKYNASQLSGLTYCCMVEIHGSPANDTTTQTQVSVGVAGLNIISDKEEYLKLLKNNTPVIANSGSIPASFTVAEQVVNLGGSLIQPNAEG